MRKPLMNVVHSTDKPHCGSSEKNTCHIKTGRSKFLIRDLIQYSEQTGRYLNSQCKFL
jgi:hypothetical protein